MKGLGKATDAGRLLRPGVLSLLIHIGLVVFLLLNLKPAPMKGGPIVYRVTLRPLVPLGDGKPPGSSSSGLPGPAGGGLTSPPDEKLKPMESPKRAEIKEAPKPPQKKTEKRIEKSDREEIADSSKKKKAPAEQRIEQTAAVGLKSPTKKEEKPRDEKEPNRSLQEAIEDIRKKAALDAIQKQVTQRDEREKSRGEGGSTSRPSQGSIASPSGNVTGSGTGSGAGAGPNGTGTGSGSGTGAGTGTGSGSGSGGSPWGGSGAVDSRLSEYYGRIWAKIKEEWTLPENLPQEKADLETIIVVIIEKDGKIQKSWFEKKSGNSLYDQMAMRAIKKAEPLPPIPKEFSDDTFEIGIRFYPD